MLRKLPFLLGLALALSVPRAAALDFTTLRLLSYAWPHAPAAKVSEIGRGIGVVFSPDLSVKDNCRFYEALGFACFQSADWSRVLDEVHRFNVLDPERRISTLVLETHGTNGNGLKLQNSYAPTGDRSYISVGALQERLESEGIYYVVISACNSGRLLRPYIYNQLDPYNGDELFLPATCGIVNASEDFDGTRSPITIITPQSSHIEATLVGSIRELDPAARRLILEASRTRGITLPKQFAISDLMMQMVTGDPRLSLTTNNSVETLSKDIQPEDRSEELLRRFKTYLNAVAAREESSARPVVR